MTITDRKTEQGYEYWFDNGSWVRLTPDEETWEFQGDEEDPETYMCGGYSVEGNKVWDYDGCFELPSEVFIAMSDYGYDIDV